MLPSGVTRTIIHSLDWVAERVLPGDGMTTRQRIGRNGEEASYFYLRRLGYVMVEKNYRSPRCHGEIDLIAWEGDVLCFIEVKTRTTREVKTAEAAVDRYKRREIAQVMREYLRVVSPMVQWRFDIVSVYYSRLGSRPEIELFRNASLKN